jgi:DNA invertase Pin-like site-specific DNA recombinase
MSLAMIMPTLFFSISAISPFQSGLSFDRPGLNRLIADATDKKINLVLCKDLSRFGRDYLEVGRYTDIVFPAIGCRFIALQDGVDSSTNNNEMVMIFKNVLNDVFARGSEKNLHGGIKKLKIIAISQ